MIGIGLNVNIPPDAFPPELSGMAASLIETSERPIDRNRLLAELLNDLEGVLTELGSQGPRRLERLYQAACATIGKRIRVLLAGSRELVGMAEAIGPDGALHVRPSNRSAEAVIEVRAADVIHLRE